MESLSNQEMFPEKVLFAVSVGTGCLTIFLASALAYILFKRGRDSKGGSRSHKTDPIGQGSSGGSAGLKTDDFDKYPGGRLDVYFGSQTGTAESFANQLAREGEKKGFYVKVNNLEDLSGDVNDVLTNQNTRDSSGRNRAIFLMATYGEGEPTDNAVTFIRSLRTLVAKMSDSEESVSSEEKKVDDPLAELHHDKSILRNVDYAVFGLGNKQYEHYNAMGKFVDSTMEKIGACRMLPLGLGDDDNDLEGDFENWKDKSLWPTLVSRYLGDQKLSSKPSTDQLQIPSSFTIEYVHGPYGPDSVNLDEVPLTSKGYFSCTSCPISRKRELRSPADGGSTLHVEIDISKSSLTYQTADNLGILPMNDSAIVAATAKALNYDLDAVFRLVPSPGNESKHNCIFPTPCTVRDLLVKYCDLTSAPRRAELKLLAQFATDPISRQALLRMAAKEGKDEYREKIFDAHVGIADIVTRLCPSLQIPLNHFIDIVPRLQPRYYTISSSSSLHPNSIHVTVSVLNIPRQDGSRFKGVCSNYLADVPERQAIQIFCRPSSFRLPKNPSTPILMIGPGTGIAPMRALLQERSYMRKVMRLNVGPNLLYFGCKNRKEDFLYADELEQYQKDRTLSQLYLAFSREHKDKKVYVQHILSTNAFETWSLINESHAHIYVCGGVKMGHDVSETLRQIISQVGGLTATDSKAYLERMAADGRFVQELWA